MLNETNRREPPDEGQRNQSCASSLWGPGGERSCPHLPLDRGGVPELDLHAGAFPAHPAQVPRVWGGRALPLLGKGVVDEGAQAGLRRCSARMCWRLFLILGYVGSGAGGDAACHAWGSAYMRLNMHLPCACRRCKLLVYWTGPQRCSSRTGARLHRQQHPSACTRCEVASPQAGLLYCFVCTGPGKGNQPWGTRRSCQVNPA